MLALLDLLDGLLWVRRIAQEPVRFLRWIFLPAAAVGTIVGVATWSLENLLVAGGGAGFWGALAFVYGRPDGEPRNPDRDSP